MNHYISRALPPAQIEYKHDRVHIILRPYSYLDINIFQSALSQTLPYLYKFTPWPLKTWDQKDCLEWLINAHGEYFLGKVFEWGCFNQEGELLLSIGILPAPSWNPDCWELGYWTVTQYMNKGLATLASKIVIALSFECFDIKRLQVGCMKENQSSIRVIEKSGFKFEGELRGCFQSPSPERLAIGAIPAKSDFLYALLPEDRIELDWYSKILENTKIYAVNQTMVKLDEIRNDK